MSSTELRGKCGQLRKRGQLTSDWSQMNRKLVACSITRMSECCFMNRDVDTNSREQTAEQVWQ